MTSENTPGKPDSLDNHTHCPKCKGRFSFAKPIDGKCPWCEPPATAQGAEGEVVELTMLAIEAAKRTNMPDGPGKMKWCFGWQSGYLSRDAEVAELREALEFYADPETYFAFAFFAEQPHGNFHTDFEETELGEKPGKRAREALTRRGK